MKKENKGWSGGEFLKGILLTMKEKAPSVKLDEETIVNSIIKSISEVFGVSLIKEEKAPEKKDEK